MERERDSIRENERESSMRARATIIIMKPIKRVSGISGKSIFRRIERGIFKMTSRRERKGCVHILQCDQMAK